ncbi:MAG: NirD/YgiW/YdeI family stress tolerance protein [Desulfovibrionaceae bacterium]|nr:NirD/YgiW/YdeI family stress tolerance protein [Desulfovibrionaceae bacterium]
MRYLFSLMIVALLAVPAVAAGQGGFQGPGEAAGNVGGFQGPSSGSFVDTVKAALGSWDDTPAVLTGHIVSRVAGSDDEYIFRDATGQIQVEIDNELFAGRNVTPQNLVRISGEVDKDIIRDGKVDVNLLEILK